MTGGIPDAQWQQILGLFSNHTNITEVIIFGSRAKGEARPGADIDIAVKGRNISSEQLTRIWAAYEDLYLPWKLDLVIYDTIANDALREHIDRVGKRVAAVSAHIQLSRRAGLVGGLTLLSRFAGLARDMAIAYVFGTALRADAFYVAFRIPNLLRRLLAEGALTMAFVPIFTRYLKVSRAAGQEAANVIFTVVCVLLAAIVAAGIGGAPWIVHVIAGGFQTVPEKFALTVRLTQLMFPYIFMASVMALMMGMLNSLKRFAAPAAAPILLNLAIIAGAAWLAQRMGEPTMGLAVGVLVGGILQLLLHWAALRNAGMGLGLTTRLRHPALRELTRIMLPSVYGGAVYQLNVIVITLLASFLPDGSVSYLWYADRITEFPLGIFAVAIATVTLPALSDHAVENDLAAFKTTANFSLRVVFAEAIPAAVGIILLATPIVRLLFEGGAFSDRSTRGTVAAVLYFAAGIPFVSGIRNLVPAFYALRDAKTPVVIATVGLVVNAITAWWLMGPFLHQGLAMGMCAASVAHFALLLGCLRRKVGLLGLRSLARGIGGVAAASALMAGAVVGLAHGLALEAADNRLDLAWRLAVTIAGGAAVYLAALAKLAPAEFRHFMALLRMRKS
ncbi:MAG: murein biosynthesis integral membrane protein MurJ [Deltaproteobacteria bacterium]|nr:murein biosynthesis integral membrane protein MurJ [Deltaproteobacteria bacterium]